MRNHPPHKLTPLFRAHNMFLSVGSLVLLVLMLEEIVPIIMKEGIYAAMCAEASWTPVRVLAPFVPERRSIDVQRMEFYYLINYSFKYLELLDTIFLAFKKKPLRQCRQSSSKGCFDYFDAQSSSTFSTTLPPRFYAFRNSMARPAL
jgi:fatty acid elongase 3